MAYQGAPYPDEGNKLNIRAALGGGWRRTRTKTGAVLIGIGLLVQVVYTIGTISVGADAPATFGSAPTVGTGLGIVLLVAGYIGISAFLVVVYRVFCAGATDSIPRRAYRELIVFATVNMMVGTIVFGIAVGIGFVLLIIPGLFLLVSLFFYDVVIAVEARTFIGGMTRSWSMARGNRFRILGMVLVLVVLAGISLGATFLLVGLDEAGWLISELLFTGLVVFSAGVTTDAYFQLSEDDTERMW